jgi:hypothetical protein
MENDLKRDVRREVRTGNGRILLHDELEHVPGQFTLTPQWETLSVDEIMTPRVSGRRTACEWETDLSGAHRMCLSS